MRFFRTRPMFLPLTAVLTAIALLGVGSIPTWAAAALSNGDVDPDNGTPATKFSYTVTYTNDADEPPITGFVVIDQRLMLRMHEVPGSGSSYADGVQFKRATRLPAGDHVYRFVFLVRSETSQRRGGGTPPARIFYPGPGPENTLDGPTVARPPLFIAGVVREGRKPVEGVIIKAAKAGQAPIQATTDANGYYKIEGLEKGRYLVTAEDPNGYYHFLPRVHKVRVPPSRRHVNFLAVGPPYIRGVVRAPGHQPIAGVTMELTKLPEASQTPTTTQTDENGRYEFTNLEPGRYRVVPSKDGYRFVPRVRIVKVPPSARMVNFLGLALPVAELDGGVEPDQGTPDTLFTYTAVYTHPDNVAPERAWLFIDNNRPVEMTKDPSDDDFTDGVAYTYQTDQLEVGDHEFRLVFAYKDGSRWIWLFWPGPRPRDTEPGPSVLSDGGAE